MNRIRAFRDRMNGCFLFGKSGAELRGARKIGFWAWNCGWMVLLALALGVLSLLLACGTRSVGVFYGYFRVPMILVLNFLPPLLLMLAAYAATGRAWIAWLISSLLILTPSLIHFYMLSFRDDPFMAKDLLLLREGTAIMGNYTITLSAWVWASLLAIPAGTVLLALLCRARPDWKPRVAVLVAVLLLLYPISRMYASETIYDEQTENYELLTRKRATDRYIGKGFWYPFLHSATELFADLTEESPREPLVEQNGDETTITVQCAEPEELPDTEPQELPPAPIRVTYSDADIPEGQKVDVVMIMLEAFSDLTTLPIKGIHRDVYDGWHTLEEESYHGRLVTNIFAAGTVNTERCALTGDPWVPVDGYDQDADSYVRYLAKQGYTVSGSHPIYGWFYDRENINAYLGFAHYDFWESRYQYMVDDIAEYLYREDLFLNDVYNLYLENTARRLETNEEGVVEIVDVPDAERKPYFGFHVTYQGHATYSDTSLVWGEEVYTRPARMDDAGEGLIAAGKGKLNANTGISDASYYILNNYLGSLRNTIKHLTLLKERLAVQGEPVVLVLFGDHKPWLGDGNSVYSELGVNLDTDTEEGFYNYYTTPYLIWANDEAKALLGSDFTGEGPDISPAYLMNELFGLCGWDGSAYMQLMDDLQQLLPVVNTDEYYVEQSGYTVELSEQAQQALDSVQQVADYRRTHVGNIKIVTEELPCPSGN